MDEPKQLLLPLGRPTSMEEAPRSNESIDHNDGKAVLAAVVSLSDRLRERMTRRNRSLNEAILARAEHLLSALIPGHNKLKEGIDAGSLPHVQVDHDQPGEAGR